MSPSPHVLVSAATSIQTANQSAYSTVDKPTVATRLFEKKSDKIKKKKTMNKSVLTAATSSTSSSSSSSDKRPGHSFAANQERGTRKEISPISKRSKSNTRAQQSIWRAAGDRAS